MRGRHIVGISRRAAVGQLLQSKPYVSLHELEERFPDVSSMTLRRDIEYFEGLGEVIKVRGGARSMKFITTSMEDAFSLRLNSNMTAKDKIARRAVDFIETGRSIFLDSGTTILKMIAHMPDERLTITTTGPNIALELVKKNLPIINMVGGMINRDNISISGNQALQFLYGINIDVAFIVPSGLSLEGGFSSGNYGECELKKTVTEKARRVVILMDASKVDRSLPYTFARFEDVDVVITNSDLPKPLKEAAKQAGVRLIVTEKE